MATGLDFNSRTTSSELNKFIDDHLQPTTEFNREMNETVHNICSFFRDHFKPSRIVKGGSLGKGTAIKGNCDIDLVLVLNEIQDAADLKRKLPGIQRKIVEKLQRESKRFVIAGSISTTQFAVKFSVKGRHENIDVDLLPTFLFTDLRGLYSKMKSDKEHEQYYSAALVEQQVEFVKACPANVKNLIRLVKYWKKQNVISVNSRRIPNSYVIELITIHLCEGNSGWFGIYDTLKAFHSVMEALKNYRSLNVIWMKYYSKCDIPTQIQQERPLVLDPANPMNNVCSKFEWEGIANAARRVLGSPMMRGVTS